MTDPDPPHRTSTEQLLANLEEIARRLENVAVDLSQRVDELRKETHERGPTTLRRD